MFELRGDKWGGQYFSVALSAVHVVNASTREPDLGSLLNPMLNVSARLSGPFSSDLTSRDDVLLAFISLVLLLVIEGLVTTVLLRTSAGNVSNFGFSAKQILAFVQELNFRAIFRRSAAPAAPPRKPLRLNAKLLVFTLALVLLTFLLEVAALFLTAPALHDVTNRIATFRILQPVVPDWHDVRYHVGRSIDLACEAFLIEGVHQADTRINGCVSATTIGADLHIFTRDDAAPDVDAEITSRLHDYGAEHSVTIADSVANFSTRAYFTLSDGQTRVMSANPALPDEPRLMDAMHKQYIAYLMSAYAQITSDPRVTVDALNAIDFAPFETGPGAPVDVLPLPGERVRVPTRLYRTRVRSSFLARGVSALRLAQHAFRGMAAMQVAPPSTEDMTIEDGIVDREAVVWKENVRVVNWLSLLLLLVAGIAILVALRFVLRPVATADLASIFVKQAVKADMGRSPMEISDGEKRTFSIEWGERDYLYGAETREGWTDLDGEYNDGKV